MLNKLEEQNETLEIKKRHTTYSDIPFVDEEILSGFFAKGERTDNQKNALKLSDSLVQELKWADILVLSTPIYNFSIPASLKAYFDLVARAGLTFKYTENGPVGLLQNKKAYIVMSSGGTEIGSDIDYAGRYVKHFLAFLGIFDVTFINLDQLMMANDVKRKQALEQIELL